MKVNEGEKMKMTAAARARIIAKTARVCNFQKSEVKHSVGLAQIF